MESESFVEGILTSSLARWSESLGEIYSVVSMSPDKFRGGAVYSIVTDINSALQATGFALLVLFFVAGVMKSCASFAELKRPEAAIRLFVRFALAKAAVTYGTELLDAIGDIVRGVCESLMEGALSPSALELPGEISEAVSDCSFLESIPLWAVSLLGALVIWILSLTLILTVYGRFFRLYMYTALAPLPLAAFAGEPTAFIGLSFIKSYAGVCMEGAVIILSCLIFSAFAATPPKLDAGAGPAVMVWKYLGETIFNMLILCGCIRMSDAVTRQMTALG